MKLKTMMVAAIAALTLVACSKDADNGGSNTVDGLEARLSVSLKLPVQARAWDDDVNATTDESDIKTITVYVFNASGTAAKDGGHTNFVKTDFNENSGVWTLGSSKNIKTVAGNVRVYVAVNVPSAKAIAYSTEAQMLAAFDGLANLSSVANGFTMFSEAVPVTLAAYDENDPSTIGTASANLDRVVSKLVATTGQATYNAEWSNGVKFVYTIKGMGVYNEAIQSYLAKNPTTLSTLNTFAASAGKTNATVKTGHTTTEADTEVLTGFYICENHDVVGDATYGKSTYAMIAATVTVSHEGNWDATADGGNGDVVYTQVTPYGGGTDDIYLVIYQGKEYVTSSEVKAKAITAGLEGKNSLSPGALDDNIYKYHKGWVHFQSFLNREGTNDYFIDRNQFIHAKINGINVVDGHFPGYPGDENNGDGEKPIDPTDKNDPNNPDPKDPDDNIDPDEAVLNIEIEINKWTYKVNEIILE